MKENETYLRNGRRAADLKKKKREKPKRKKEQSMLVNRKRN